MGKAGRKRKTGVKREPNGKPSRVGHRATAEQDAMSVAAEYRQRVFGLSEADRMDQKAATLLGRLCLHGVISEAQWQAGEDWLALSVAMSALVNAPRGFSTTSSGGVVDDAAHTRHYIATKAKWDDANRAIEDHAPVLERKARFVAMRAIVIDEIDNPRMHGALRTALNGLVRYFGLERRRAA